MLRVRRTRVLALAGFLCTAVPSLTGCGPASSGANQPTENTDAKTSTQPQDAASAAKASGTGGKDGKPFAGSTSEATELISSVVDGHRSQISACVRGYRARKKVASSRVAVSFGIDQEGRLLGVTSKGKEDAELKTCVQDALQNAPFPRSHAGVITVTKSYEDLVIE